ncbi:cyclase family protein [Pseudonocardia sp. RS11V-5]|uniref:cyclase family protein n=1 Tax=Pseudonocardia terrae TaxID=2905831 RepID=UPI001E350E28|nr:cyclase family protein [Pseudonocardia terrae]MCE3550706.1 cyclase family protein [Pseudonocardia terrae]
MRTAARAEPAGRQQIDAPRGRLVDLTLLVAEELPCWWSTHMPYQHKTFNWFADRADPAAPLLSRTGPYQTRWMLIDEHTGTHVDAPAHFVPPPGSGLPHEGEQGTVTVDRVPLEQLAGPAAVIDVPEDLPGAGPGVSPTIEPGLLHEHERDHGPIEAGTVVLFRTGWDRRYHPGAEGDGYCFDALVARTGPGWPAPEVPIMTELLGRGVRCVGTDAPSMGSSHDGGPVHVAGLSRGAVFVEALHHLERLPSRGAYFLFAPLNIARGTGAPGRAMAWVPTDDGSRPA